MIVGMSSIDAPRGTNSPHISDKEKPLSPAEIEARIATLDGRIKSNQEYLAGKPDSSAIKMSLKNYTDERDRLFVARAALAITSRENVVPQNADVAPVVESVSDAAPAANNASEIVNPLSADEHPLIETPAVNDISEPAESMLAEKPSSEETSEKIRTALRDFSKFVGITTFNEDTPIDGRFFTARDLAFGLQLTLNTKQGREKFQKDRPAFIRALEAVIQQTLGEGYTVVVPKVFSEYDLATQRDVSMAMSGGRDKVYLVLSPGIFGPNGKIFIRATVSTSYTI